VARLQRPALERLCRYVARPALATERLHGRPDGRLENELRHPWADGTTAAVSEPGALLGRLSALVQLPRAHLATYHGASGLTARASAVRLRRVAEMVSERPGR
jgi:hypothetical protein